MKNHFFQEIYKQMSEDSHIRMQERIQIPLIKSAREGSLVVSSAKGTSQEWELNYIINAKYLAHSLAHKHHLIISRKFYY